MPLEKERVEKECGLRRIVDREERVETECE